MGQRFEQFQKLQEEMAKLHHMSEAQNNMMAQMVQSATMDKGKSRMTITREETEGISLDLTPSHGPVQLGEYPQRLPVTIRTQKGQADTRLLMNFQASSGSNSGGSPANHVVLDFDEMGKMDKAEVDLLRQLEERCERLEEKFKAMKIANYRYGVDAKDLCLVLDLVLPPKFKTPKFEKYNGTSCPKEHITMFCRKMGGHVNNDKLLIHCFQDSLVGSAARWYYQLSRAQIKTWMDLAQAFMKRYDYMVDIAPTRITLQNMEIKPSESFRQYALRWKEIAAQVQPPLLEKETTILFINTLKAPFINYMLGSTTKSFSDIVMSGEMIENAIRCGKIEAGEATRRFAPKQKDDEGLLEFYGLPLHQTLGQPSANSQTSLPEGVKFELRTLPVDVKAILDGDTITVYVSTTEPLESSNIPKDVRVAAAQRSKACADKNYTKADALQKKITISGYRVLNVRNQEILARKYRIRLRGIDAPESSMPYGKEAKEELVKLVGWKCLRVLVYGEDRYGRCVGDIYCNGKFVQEIMLKKGLAWHYSVYDQRIELATWENEARARRVGLWALSNPEKPWEWRKDKRQGR